MPADLGRDAIRQQLPPQYGTNERSPLRVSVTKDGVNEFTFDLVDGGS